MKLLSPGKCCTMVVGVVVLEKNTILTMNGRGIALESDSSAERRGSLTSKDAEVEEPLCQADDSFDSGTESEDIVIVVCSDDDEECDSEEEEETAWVWRSSPEPQGRTVGKARSSDRRGEARAARQKSPSQTTLSVPRAEKQPVQKVMRKRTPAESKSESVEKKIRESGGAKASREAYEKEEGEGKTLTPRKRQRLGRNCGKEKFFAESGSLQKKSEGSGDRVPDHSTSQVQMKRKKKKKTTTTTTRRKKKTTSISLNEPCEERAEVIAGRDMQLSRKGEKKKPTKRAQKSKISREEEDGVASSEAGGAGDVGGSDQSATQAHQTTQKRTSLRGRGVKPTRRNTMKPGGQYSGEKTEATSAKKGKKKKAAKTTTRRRKKTSEAQRNMAASEEATQEFLADTSGGEFLLVVSDVDYATNSAVGVDLDFRDLSLHCKVRGLHPTIRSLLASIALHMVPLGKTAFHEESGQRLFGLGGFRFGKKNPKPFTQGRTFAFVVAFFTEVLLPMAVKSHSKEEVPSRARVVTAEHLLGLLASLRPGALLEELRVMKTFKTQKKSSASASALYHNHRRMSLLLQHLRSHAFAEVALNNSFAKEDAVLEHWKSLWKKQAQAVASCQAQSGVIARSQSSEKRADRLAEAEEPNATISPEFWSAMAKQTRERIVPPIAAASNIHVALRRVVEDNPRKYDDVLTLARKSTYCRLPSGKFTAAGFIPPLVMVTPERARVLKDALLFSLALELPHRRLTGYGSAVWRTVEAQGGKVKRSNDLLFGVPPLTTELCSGGFLPDDETFTPTRMRYADKGNKRGAPGTGWMLLSGPGSTSELLYLMHSYDMYVRGLLLTNRKFPHPHA